MVWKGRAVIYEQHPDICVVVFQVRQSETQSSGKNTCSLCTQGCIIKFPNLSLFNVQKDFFFCSQNYRRRSLTSQNFWMQVEWRIIFQFSFFLTMIKSPLSQSNNDSGSKTMQLFLNAFLCLQNISKANFLLIFFKFSIFYIHIYISLQSRCGGD